MPVLRPAAAASLLAAAAFSATWPASAASASALVKPEMTVTPAQNLADGAEVTVKGTGFVPGTLLFVAICDSKKSLGSACDTGNYAKATTGADGSLSTELKAVRVFGDTDCAATTCALMTNDPANPRDTRNYVSVPLTFAGGGGPAVASSPAAQKSPAAKKEESGSGARILVIGGVALVLAAAVALVLVRRSRSTGA